jgi:hypothetical protein
MGNRELSNSLPGGEGEGNRWQKGKASSLSCSALWRASSSDGTPRLPLWGHEQAKGERRQIGWRWVEEGKKHARNAQQFAKMENEKKKE